MITYEQFKEKMAKKIIDLKPKIIYAFCLVVVFTAGWGVGRGVSQKIDASSSSEPINYTTKTSAAGKPAPAKTPAETGANGTDVTAATGDKTLPATPTAITGTKPDPNKPCPIKGSKSKIYHMKGGTFYDRTNAVECFNTESEAKARGYRKSSK